MEDAHEKKKSDDEKAECSAHLSDNDAQRGVPIQAASAELTDPYANEALSDGVGDEAENLEIGTDEETVNESTDEEENIEIEAEDEFDSADDGEEEALDIESETEDAMMESGDSGESAFYSEQRVEYHNKFKDEEEYWLSAGQGSSFSFETEKVVYKEDGNIDYSATEKVRYEIISVVNSNPDAVSVTYSEGGSSVAYQCKEIGDADLTVTYKLPDDETETTYTWLCHMHVTDVQYTVKLAKTNAFQNPIYSGGRDNTMVTGTKAVITAGIDSYNEYERRNSTVVDKNTLYEGSDYTFEWSISDDPNVTLTSNANQCELQVGNQSQGGRFKLSLKTTVVKATASKDGAVTKACTGCDVKETTVIPYVKTIALSKTSYAYNGKVQKPSVTVKDAKNGSLKLNTDYTVAYSGGQKNAGTYKVVVKGKGNYDFTKTLTYKITVSKTGKVTVKKGLKKGTYKVKIKVSAAAVTNYNAASATKTIKVVVK